MSKIKVLFHQIFYPLSIGRYWEKALQNHPDIDLKTTGVYTGAWIPWMGGMEVEQKYALSPDIPLPFKPNIGKVPYEIVKAQLDGWTPDLVLTVDAGVNWVSKPSDGIVATIGTDAHVLDYSHARSISDYFFNMHPRYSKEDDVKLHYAYCKHTHYSVPEIEKDTDAVLIGMPYQSRIDWVNRLRSEGVSVLFENRPIFDEYRELNNRARIGLNWSSLGDLNARVYELMSMKLCPVIDRCPDLDLMGFEEDVHYLGFTNLGEAVEKVLWAKNNPKEAENIASNAYLKVTSNSYSYTKLLHDVLQKVGLE